MHLSDSDSEYIFLNVGCEYILAQPNKIVFVYCNQTDRRKWLDKLDLIKTDLFLHFF